MPQKHRPPSHRPPSRDKPKQSWKPPATTKPQRSRRPESPRSPSTNTPLSLPLDLQQSILDTFASAFFSLPTSAPRETTVLQERIQEVKSHLYNRGFLAAFDTEAKREAYALRWSAGRAGAYAVTFREYARLLFPPKSVREGAKGSDEGQGNRKEKHLWNDANRNVTEDTVETEFRGKRPGVGETRVLEGREQKDESTGNANTEGKERRAEMVEKMTGGRENERRDGYLADGIHELQIETGKQKEKLKVICVGGGGGAEIVGLATCLREQGATPADEADNVTTRLLDVTVVDSADWASLTTRIVSSLRTNLLPRSLETCLTAMFEQKDVFSLEQNCIKSVYGGANLVTICFTLNELYSASVATTTKFLLNLTDTLDVRAVLCVIDSPGSYSTVKLGKPSGEGAKQKRYPMAWLLNHTLMEVAISESPAGGSKAPKWEKLFEEESKWFRWAKTGLSYETGLEVEDMRFQLHVYRRI